MSYKRTARFAYGATDFLVTCAAVYLDSWVVAFVEINTIYEYIQQDHTVGVITCVAYP